MAKVHAMDLTKKTAIMVASAEPIRVLLREMVDEADGRTRYLAGKVTTQAFVNGLILWLRSKAEGDRAQAVDEALKLIAAIEQDEMTTEEVKARGKGGRLGSVGSESVVFAEAPGRQVKRRGDPDSGGENAAVVAKHRAPPRKK